MGRVYVRACSSTPLSGLRWLQAAEQDWAGVLLLGLASGCRTGLGWRAVAGAGLAPPVHWSAHSLPGHANGETVKGSTLQCAEQACCVNSVTSGGATSLMWSLLHHDSVLTLSNMWLMSKPSAKPEPLQVLDVAFCNFASTLSGPPLSLNRFSLHPTGAGRCSHSVQTALYPWSMSRSRTPCGAWRCALAPAVPRG